VRKDQAQAALPEDERVEPRRRGRPRGPTTQGIETRQRLYETALALISARGWEAATLRDVAREAGVSVGLLYRYFPSKHAVLLELYDQLSLEFARQTAELPAGRWRDRVVYALETHLRLLRPHRATLTALLPVLVGPAEGGLFSEQTAFARERDQAIFLAAVKDASDAPDLRMAEALSRLLYVLHLCVVLWWTLDKTPGQRATDQLVTLIGQALRPFAIALRLPVVRRLVQAADRLVREALLD
jgi:AcrR family transcriptional regulator